MIKLLKQTEYLTKWLKIIQYCKHEVGTSHPSVTRKRNRIEQEKIEIT